MSGHLPLDTAENIKTNNVLFFIQDGSTALHFAAYYGESEIMLALIGAKADLNVQNKVCSNILLIC